MKLSNRRLWIFGAIAIGAIILITLLAAPASNKLNSGSTYNRAPDGYGAWYAFMSERGTPVQRWRKPFEDLANNKDAKPPITLLRVYSNLTSPGLSQSLIEQELTEKERNWVESGNTLVILGVHQPVTEAPFSSTHKAGTLSVKIDTQRREKKIKEGLLGDRFGAIVWEESIGKGRVIFATTPHLAANAYQDFQGNYEFLAQLVSQSGVPGQQRTTDNRAIANRPTGNSQNPSSLSEKENQVETGRGEWGVGSGETGNDNKVSSNLQNSSPIPYSLLPTPRQTAMWVDEYIHGYKDSELITKREYANNRAIANRSAGNSQSGGSGQQGTTGDRSTANRPTGNSQSGGSGQQGTTGDRSTANRPTGNSQNPVWVDEYIHGHKDSEVIKREQREDIFSYLAKTPLFPAFVQGFILLLVAIWTLNRRFGKPLTLSAPVVDNSEAYIQALGGVLQKANSSEFILEVVGKEEQLQLQKALGLGQVLLDHQSLVEAWVLQTGRPATELEQLLQVQSRKRRMSETDLLTWLGNWEQIRRHLPS